MNNTSLTTINNTIPTNDPLHGLLLGNTTAFDAVNIQQQGHRTHISPSKQTTDKDSSLIINGKIFIPG